MNLAIVNPIKKNQNIPQLSPGDTVKVAVKVVEGDKSRIQPFQGVVIRVRPDADGSGNFTVRRVTFNVGVERTFLFGSPLVEKVEVLRHGKVRRASLYYLRGISEKASRLKETRRAFAPEVMPAVEAAPEATPEAAAPETPAAPETKPTV
jgi:large subunit ribosomal protein L19